MSSEDIIPSPGLGTWQNTDPEECVKSVKTALDIGYRHVDTAQVYGNEKEVGKGIKESDVDRKDVFLATKVWIDQLSGEDVVSSTEESLDKLGVDKVDLLYVHWPGGDYEPVETMNAFNQLVDEDKVSYIGVSNFSPEMVDEAQKHSEADILANQVEMHPFLQQEELVEYCQENEVYLVAYSPLARGKVMDSTVLQEIADKHGVTPAQVSIAWLNSIDYVVPIPKSSSEDHIRENFEAVDLELDEEDIEKIENIDREERCVDPDIRKGW